MCLTAVLFHVCSYHRTCLIEIERKINAIIVNGQASERTLYILYIYFFFLAAGCLRVPDKMDFAVCIWVFAFCGVLTCSLQFLCDVPLCYCFPLLR